MITSNISGLKKLAKTLSSAKIFANFAPESTRQSLCFEFEIIQGKMPEWSIGTVSKTVVPLRVPRVRIPVFPQINRLQVIDLQPIYL